MFTRNAPTSIFELDKNEIGMLLSMTSGHDHNKFIINDKRLIISPEI